MPDEGLDVVLTSAGRDLDELRSIALVDLKAARETNHSLDELEARLAQLTGDAFPLSGQGLNVPSCSLLALFALSTHAVSDMHDESRSESFDPKHTLSGGRQLLMERSPKLELRRTSIREVLTFAVGGRSVSYPRDGFIVSVSP